MISDTCLSSFGARLFSWLLWFSWFPGSLRCVAQNPRILLMVNLIQRIHYSYACAFYFSFPLYFSHRDPMSRCHLTVCKCKTLPTEQAAPALTDSFSRGDPSTHACKARPPMTVGRTSLSVIVNSGLELFKIRQAHTLRTPPSPRQIADCIDEGKAASCFRLNRVFLWTTTCVLGWYSLPAAKKVIQQTYPN